MVINKKPRGGHRKPSHSKMSGSNRSYGGSRRGGGGNNNNNSKSHGKSREKYLAMSRNALSSGDRIEAEYYAQFVEHYTRMISEAGGDSATNVSQSNNNINNNIGESDNGMNESPVAKVAKNDESEQDELKTLGANTTSDSDSDDASDVEIRNY